MPAPAMPARRVCVFMGGYYWSRASTARRSCRRRGPDSRGRSRGTGLHAGPLSCKMATGLVDEKGGDRMRIARALTVLAFLAGLAPASATDLAKVGRTIAKEPTYKSRPQYCLLVLGAEAKFRVWLVQDGGALYVDRNGNGDLTEAGKATAWKGNYCNAGLVTDPVSKCRYQLSLRKYPKGLRLTVVKDGKQRFMVGDPD